MRAGGAPRFVSAAARPARVAIVGAGPAGFFLADALSRQPAIELDLFERLPFPYGLVRYGVAPDHQGTKAVTRTFARTMARPGVRFLGGVCLGIQVSLEDLRRGYDAVVLATGAAAGRKLAFDGAELPGSIAAFNLARWINGHPAEESPLLPATVQSVVVLGHGNVAIDMARLLASAPTRLAPSDANPDFLSWLERQSLRRIQLCGRGGPGRTRFSPEMLAELRDLPGVALLRSNDALCSGPAGEGAAAALITALPTQAPAPGLLPVELQFGQRPLAFDGRTLLVETAARERRSLPAELVVHAVGQEVAAPGTPPPHSLPRDADGAVANEEGRVRGEERLFVLGWAAGTTRGTIPDSRIAARRLAPAVAEAATAAARAQPKALPDLRRELPARGIAVTDWPAWSALDRLELDRGASVGAHRRKLLRLPGED